MDCHYRDRPDRALRCLLVGLARFNTFSKVSLIGLAFFMSACGVATNRLADNELGPKTIGRHVLTADGTQKAGWPGSGTEFAFEGTKATIEITDGGRGFMDLRVNDQASILELKLGTHKYVLVESETPDDFHIRLTRRSESYDTGLFELSVPELEGEFTPFTSRPRKLLFLGDSITAGFGVAGTSKTCENAPKLHAPLESYAHLTAEALNADAHLIAISGRGVIHNWDSNPAPVMPEQIDLALPDRPDMKWDHSKFQPDAVIVLLGTNDWSVIDPGQEAFRTGYRDMLSELRHDFKNAHIATVGGPLLSGDKGAAIRDGRDWALAELGDPNISSLDVELADYGVIWSCSYHPGKTSMKKMANALINHFEDVLGWDAEAVIMPSRIQAPAVLPEGGQAHFGKRLEEISTLPPIIGGTVLIGDSITEGWLSYKKIETYPFNLPVANHGVGWDVTEGADLRLPLVEPSEPSQIFIKIGTNDISLDIPLAEMERHFNGLLSGLRNQEPQAELFVQSVLPREADKLERVSRVNAMQAKLAQKYAASYIDLTEVFAAQDGTLRKDLTYDGLHLNEAGYAVWGEALSPYIK